MGTAIILFLVAMALALFVAWCLVRAGAMADARQQELFDAKFGAEWNALLDERRGQITQDVFKKGNDDEA